MYADYSELIRISCTDFSPQIYVISIHAGARDASMGKRAHRMCPYVVQILQGGDCRAKDASRPGVRIICRTRWRPIQPISCATTYYNDYTQHVRHACNTDNNDDEDDRRCTT